ncbi:MAG TPA: sigma 54-interacting transcriptional regulator [Polyangia bacterium]|nr:sigma 54-interacting transcriptional regulator [Polyangia bacterium]
MSDDPSQQTTAAPTRRGARERDPLGAELRVVMPSALAVTIPIMGGRLVLGRSPDPLTDPLAATLTDASVSRRHFAIEWDAARAFHTGGDLGSRYGSFVNAVPAISPLPLADGAVIRLGPTVVAVFQSPGGSGPGGEGDGPALLEAIPGEAPLARALRADVARVAADPSPVLLVGETGTGKEHIAEEIHRLSGRQGDLVAVNCAALTPALIESQLFGHTRGAFTGADEAQRGLFREADGGTLLLDEIGELPLELQPKLLRAIQEREVRPVGSTRTFPVDVRVIAATNRNLTAQVEQGGFRRDLYGRLSLWEIAIPPLRRRRGDLFMWLERLRARWLAERSRAVSVRPWVFEGRAAEALLLRDWRDNLRGIDRLVHALAGSGAGGRDDEPLTFEVLPSWLWESSLANAPAGDAPPAPAPRAAPTRDELSEVLARNHGSIRATARHFGRDRKQIYRWMDALGLREKSPER